MTLQESLASADISRGQARIPGLPCCLETGET